jgi:hypothetical protein
MKTDDLILSLAADGPSRSPVASKAGFAGAIGLAGFAAAMTFAIVFGPRESFAPPALQATAYKLCVTGLLAVASLFVFWRLRRPDVRTGGMAIGLAFALVAAVGITIDQMAPVEGTALQRMVGIHPWLCLLLVPVISALPLAILVAFMRPFAVADPALAGAIAGAGAAAIGASFYALGCTNDSPLFVLVWYGFAGLIVTGVGAALGRRFLSW